MTLDEATKHVRQAVAFFRQAGNEKRANDLESAVLLLVSQAEETARRTALDTAARVIREL